MVPLWGAAADSCRVPGGRDANVGVSVGVTIGDNGSLSVGSGCWL